ncbi:MAG: G5 domain-containing protein [Acutalibacteraceae bacterium]
MERIKHTAVKIKTVLRHRMVAMSALLAAIALMIGYVTVNMRLVSISDGEQNHRIMSMSTDSGAILRALGLEVEEEDVVTAEWQFARGEINVERAFDISVSVDGVKRVISMTEGTVADALKKAGVRLSKDDITSMPLDTVLTESAELTVDRVTYAERQELAAIPYSSASYESADLNKGETRVQTAGVNGEVTKTYRDRLVNGKVVESVQINETVSKEPVNEVVIVGTYEEPISAPADAVISGGGSTGSFTYSKVYTGSATAYTNENGLCGEYTASGMKAQRGVVAVDPNVIPYGTRLYITSVDGSFVYGYCVAGDTGGFVYNGTNTITDLFFDTLAECYAFGRRDVYVYVLD